MQNKAAALDRQAKSQAATAMDYEYLGHLNDIAYPQVDEITDIMHLLAVVRDNCIFVDPKDDKMSLYTVGGGTTIK